MKNVIIIFLLIASTFSVLTAQEEQAKLSIQRGDMVFARGQYDRAVDYYSRAIDYYSRASKGAYLEAYFKRGNANHFAKKYTDAIKDFDKCIENNYKVDDAKHNKELAANEHEKIAKTESKTDFGSGVNSEYMAQQFYKEGMNKYVAGDYQRALSFFDSAIGTNSSFADAYAFKALINSHLENFEDVIKDCNKAMEMKESLKDARISDLYFSRGNAYCKLEKNEKAISDLNEAIKLDSRSGHYYTVRGVAKYKLGNIKDACEDWNLARKWGEDVTELIKKNCK